jgi:NAD kinase
MQIEKIVVVTKKTALEELVERLNSVAQARFYLEQNGVDFRLYEQQHTVYQTALKQLRSQLPRALKQQVIERSMLASYQFSAKDLVVTLGPDGLVINTAKYLDGQPIIALNPDPSSIDGVLIPFGTSDLASQIARVERESASITEISMAKATLNDGQQLYAVNDLFIGTRGHASARYELRIDQDSERQSSSGIIISTGAGSTGWLSSVLTGAWRVASHFTNIEQPQPHPSNLLPSWSDERLWYSVREPFVSKSSHASLVFGCIEPGRSFSIVSHMPDAGLIFSDGIESDFLSFNSGAIARISLAERKAQLVVR